MQEEYYKRIWKKDVTQERKFSEVENKLTKRKIFILLDPILILQVILTNSRNAQVAILVFACVFFLLQFSPRIRIIVIVSVILCSGIFIFYILSDDVWMTLLLERFLHTNASMSGQDSSIIRFQMWYDACLCLSENIAWLCGMGDSYVSEYLLQKYSLGSSHNVFMDLLFTGGLVRLGIYIATLIDAYKVICKIKDFVIRNVLIATFYTVIVHSFFDSFTIMFQSGYYSVIVTLLIVFIPQYYEGGDVVNV